MFRISILFFCVQFISYAGVPNSRHDLLFNNLATRWDEAVPLGNGMVGALIWKENDRVRFSLDRADLWDKRPVANFQKPEFTFQWLSQHVLKDDIRSVQDLIDAPYDREPAPTKIPAGRLEMEITGFSSPRMVRLDLAKALCTVQWATGVEMQTFVHAVEPVGWFRLHGVKKPLRLQLIPPPFGGDSEKPAGGDSLSGQELSRLGYPPPQLDSGSQFCSYRQEGWGGFQFAIYCSWFYPDEKTVIGVWTIASGEAGHHPLTAARERVNAALARSYDQDFNSHTLWWKRFWEKSSITLPDAIIETQWYREMYKFGSASRRGAPPISLQAVWTADERRIPPWKGDFHHDLNTQLSYWPCYSANHLEEGLAYLDWLWEVKPAAEAWTHKFYQLDGLNFPGVSDIQGQPLGGWNQYSCSPTTAAWLAHHFYLQWRYSMDREFLKIRAYPWIRSVATFLQEHSLRLKDGKRSLPLSSSPEINDNRLEAWFRQTTNYDLSLIRWLYRTAAELAEELGYDSEALTWKTTLSEWPELARAEEDGRLLVAPGYPLPASHRHFSHLMAIHPLGLIDRANGEQDRRTLENSLAELKRLGPDYWCGYSYAWLANMYARAGNGKEAAEALRIFAQCFCSPNTFHLNGDQSKTGKSKFTYRPFTLEGNFAFAAGVQEMLLQSQGGVIRLFPAIPASWDKVSFETLRVEGAFLLSARREKGVVWEVVIQSEKGGTTRLENPFGARDYQISGVKKNDIRDDKGILWLSTQAGQRITLKNP